MYYRFINEYQIQPCPRNGVLPNGDVVSNLAEHLSLLGDKADNIAVQMNLYPLITTEKPETGSNQRAVARYTVQDGSIVQSWDVITQVPEVDPIKTHVETLGKTLAASFTAISTMDMDIVPQEAGYLADLYAEWEPGQTYQPGTLLQYQGVVLQVRQTVTAQEHQPPFSEGMTAVYIPFLVPDQNGVKPFVYGCAAQNGELFYGSDGYTYKYIGVDNPSCVYPPSKGLPAIWECL